MHYISHNHLRKMPYIIIIDKTGAIKSTNSKDVSADTLYKKAGFKSGDDFKLQHTWTQTDGLDCSISLYAKTTGRAGQENKYDFPPPADTQLFFGSCVIVRYNEAETEVQDLKESDWKRIYEQLFGGFEDIGSEDSEDEVSTEDELVTLGKTVSLTKQNYVKDGFVVDDDEEEGEANEEYEGSDDEPVVKKAKPGRKPKAGQKAKTATKPKKVAVVELPVEPPNVEEFQEELEEEAYE